MRRNGPLLLGLLLGAPAAAGRRDKNDRKDAADEKGMMMLDLSKVLGSAYDMPPELSDRAAPGTVLQITAQGYKTVKTGCVDATPNENPLTSVSMQSSLAGGVAWRFGGVGAEVAATKTLQVSFTSPYILGFELVEFVPSDDCFSDLKAFSKRHPLEGLVLVQESLFASINGCGEVSGSGSAGVPGVGEASVEASMECQIFSDLPVAVGVRAVPLTDFPELAGLSSAPVPVAAAPAAAAPVAASPKPSSSRSSSSKPSSSRSSSSKPSSPKSRKTTEDRNKRRETKEARVVVSAGPAFAQAEELFAQRSNKSQLEAAIAQYEAAWRAAPTDRKVGEKLVRSLTLLGEVHLSGDDDAEARTKAWDRAVTVGKQCMSINAAFAAAVRGGTSPGDAAENFAQADVPCVYWTAQALGHWASANGIATVLKNKDTLTRWMTRVSDLDRTALHGGPDRYWGRYYATLPSFAGGDLGKANDYFEASLQAAPHFLGTKVAMAETWAIRGGDRDAFVRLLNEVLSASVGSDPDTAPENRTAQTRAQSLLDDQDEHF
jgi:hypothetical protein